MRELREILAAYDALRRRGGHAVLATVMRVAGSTYRRAGARLLAPEGGEALGLISGGCLEGDVLEHGREVLATGEPRLVRYDTRSDDDIVWGLGLGCNGLVDVLIERVPDEAARLDALDFVATCLRDGAGALATVFRVEGGSAARLGDRFALGADGRLAAGRSGTGLDARVGDALRGALASGRSAVERLELSGGAAELLLEVVEPPLPLLIAGGGPDALPVARLAAELGWDTCVVDRRPAYADPARFAGVARVLECEPADAVARVPVDARSAALVMTHNYHLDLEFLRALLPSPARYVGLLGPRRRSERLLKELGGQGLSPTAAQLARFYAPVGLDIGADTPEEIAIAILAEVRAVLAGRAGGRLRERSGPIHDADA